MTNHSFIALTAAGDDERLLGLPFDQYGRYRMIREAVTAMAQALGRERLAILDVGGFYQDPDGTPRLPAAQFLGEHALTVLDVVPCELEGYIQGDGTALTFGDSSFDLVISCDTLEHIPAPDRPRFLGELARVAAQGVMLVCPTHDYETELAERVLDAYIQAELHARHDQLREHREYGLPALSLIRRELNAAGYATRDYPSGYLPAWLPMMLAKHYLLRFGESQPEFQLGLDELYNRQYSLAERRAPSYRNLVVAAKDPAAPWLAAVDGALAPTISAAAPAADTWQALGGQVLGLLQIGAGQSERQVELGQLRHHVDDHHRHIDVLGATIQQQHEGALAQQQHIAALADSIRQQHEGNVGLRTHISGLDRVIADQQTAIVAQQASIHALAGQIGQLQEQLRQRAEQVADLEQRAQWLQGQANAARAQLDAVQNGRVLRILRRLGR